MSVYKSVVSSKGQVVLPAELRKHLGIGAGSEVVFSIDGDRAYLSTNVFEQIKGLRGKFAHMRPSLSETLRRERMKERKREDRER